MGRNFPGFLELALFAVLAAVCVGVIDGFMRVDVGLAVMAFPVFLSCALLGMWISGRLRFPRDDTD